MSTFLSGLRQLDVSELVMVVIFFTAVVVSFGVLVYLIWKDWCSAHQMRQEFATWEQEWQSRSPVKRIGDDDITPERFPWLFENKRDLSASSEPSLKVYSPEIDPGISDRRAA